MLLRHFRAQLSRIILLDLKLICHSKSLLSTDYIFTKLVLVMWGSKFSSLTATLMNVHASDHLGEGCY